METESLSPTVFGSLCYVSDHRGFFGTIKNSSADFVVTEIDVSGQLVTEVQARHEKSTEKSERNGAQDIIRKQRINPKDAERKGTTCEFTEFATDISGTGGSQVQTSDIVEDDCELDPCRLLYPVLDVHVQESLNQFACTVRSVWRSSVTANDLSELSLGLYPEKDERALIHSAVRQTFPFLVTFTKSSELFVKPNLDYQELCQLTSEKEADAFFKFLDAKLENSRFTFNPDDCKEHRTAVHHFISKKFGKLVETKSFSEKDISGLLRVCITVRFREKIGSSRKRNRTEDTEKQDVYTGFTLQKDNLETLEAISYLSCILGVLPSDFSYAGIKDKKAITYQAMVVKKVTPERLKQIDAMSEKKGMKIKNIHPVNKHLQLGHLSGNHFNIIVRDIQNHSDDLSVYVQERIEEAVYNIKTKGFLNYYGPQRFGKGQNCQSHDIGLALLKEEMERAVTLLLTPDSCEDPVNNAKQYFIETVDAKGTLALMPHYKIRERMVLRAINRYGMNNEGCVRAWLSLPHSSRIFYIHAFCSKVWNEAASYRFTLYGTKVVQGDLVDCNESANENSLVHIVTAEEEESSAYTIDQVVLPMPGYSIKYPTNKIGQWYSETLAKAGLQSCAFRVSSLQLNVPGCYRHILKYPHDLFYKLTFEDQAKGTENKIADAGVSLKPVFVVEFDLDSSCYATVCLREMMKCNF
ncbi:pseudouridylate synthase 7 homolog-like protein [Xenopus tropicalis]|uniref:Pseudouridylate synthase PUS7L n=1 Tax=Xenopus tropicalis TaxID=8364 RepID=A9JTM8_XENTR|nr:pseudouridylate synthase PUS7L [Xenopus tropicalis]AAI55408.1 LOC100127797 protein [Xenopus tropicalis]|eukprot:NP_001106585.1 pseudouridylate synthase 7 homolog-like protein [Xenopus tropicalis]